MPHAARVLGYGFSYCYTRAFAGLAPFADANAQLDFVGDNDYYTPLLACTKRGSDDVAKVPPPTPSCAARPWSVRS